MKNLYINNIVEQYFKSNNYFVKEGSSGMNNTTKFLVVDNKEYILRIYESHNEIEKVIYEHCVLKALKQRKLSFSIPEPQYNLNGKTIVTSSDGKLITIANMIKGRNPELKSYEQFYSFGKVVGEITYELAKVNIDMDPIYSACYELEKSYPKCPLNKVIEFCTSPPYDFEEDKKELREISKYFLEFQKFIPILRRLPHQLIHGDINASNVLEDNNNNISAVLDFEFVAKDLRAMDLAICLSEAIANDNEDEVKFSNMSSFIKGYKEYINLTIDEIRVVPYLIMLRRLDVIIHFLVRYNEGISNNFMSAKEILKEQVKKALILCEWVNRNEERIIRLFI